MSMLKGLRLYCAVPWRCRVLPYDMLAYQLATARVYHAAPPRVFTRSPCPPFDVLLLCALAPSTIKPRLGWSYVASPSCSVLEQYCLPTVQYECCCGWLCKWACCRSPCSLVSWCVSR